jgi:hypothetical protein
MKKLFTEDEFNIAKSYDSLYCECYNCETPFLIQKKLIKQELKHKRNRCKFCSTKCNNLINNKKLSLVVKCLNCNTEFEKALCQIKKSPNHFCSKSCSVTYNNKHKRHGNRRSKLEVWIERRLTDLYPELHIDYNKSDTIGSELDIYIPSLNIAFELNGIFHYEPIYGIDKLSKIKENDLSKSKACHDYKIDLCIIDTSNQKYVKPSTSQKYLDIIINIINQRTIC